MDSAILLFVASQAVALGAGLLLLVALACWKLPVGLLVPTAWLVGCGALALERLLLAQAGLPWNVTTLGLPWVGVALLAAWQLRRGGREFEAVREWWATTRSGLKDRAAWVDLVAVLVIVGWTVALMLRTFAQPLYGWDAQVLWMFKGRAIFDAGTIDPAFFTNPSYDLDWHMDYPLLVPLTIARIFAWTGDQEVIVKGWWSLLSGAAAAGIYFGLSGLVGRAARLGGALLLMTPQVIVLSGADGWVGFADLPVGVFFLYGGLFVYRWFVGGEKAADAWLAAVFFGMAGFTKNEGLVVALAGLIVLLVVMVVRGRLRPASAGAIVGTIGLFIVPWQVEKGVLGIEGDLNPTIGGVLANWQGRIGQIMNSLASYFLDMTAFGMVWPVFALSCIAALALTRRRWVRTLPLLALVLMHLAGIVAAFISTPRDLTWHLTTSADRLLFQAMPLAVLLSAIYMGGLLERGSKEAEE